MGMGGPRAPWCCGEVPQLMPHPWDSLAGGCTCCRTPEDARMLCKPPQCHSITEAIGFSGVGDEGEPQRAGPPGDGAAVGSGALGFRPCAAPGWAVLRRGAGAEPPQVKVGEEEHDMVTQTC